MIPEPTGEALRWAMVFMREPEVVRVDKTAKVGLFKQAFCKETVFPLPVL